jgi:hypothetical protein
LEKVTNEAEQKASDTKEQAKQAVQGKAPEAEKQTKRAAEKVLSLHFALPVRCNQ